MNNVFDKLHEYHGIPIETLTKYILYHNLDVLSYQEKMIIVRHIYKVNPSEKIDVVSDDEFSVEKLMRDYFDKKIVTYRDQVGIILVKDTDPVTWKILTQNPENRLIWREIDDFEYTNFTNGIQKFIVNKSKINSSIGFMSVFKGGEVTFKTKLLSGKWNNTGANCSVLGKKDVINRINSILDEPVYSNEFIKKYSTRQILKNGMKVEKKKENGIYKLGLCVILEILLRYYNDIGHNGKIWFFDNEIAELNGIITFKTE
jgi:hypothetical protein